MPDVHDGDASTDATAVRRSGPGQRARPGYVLVSHAVLLALGLGTLALVMYRPVPGQIEQWNSAGSVWALLSNAAPDSVGAARVLLAAPLLLLVATHLRLLQRAQRCVDNDRLLAPILAGAAALATVPALARHTFSGDVAAYVMYGRVAALHHANPMTVAPDSFPQDPFLPLMADTYRGSVSVYGPAWNLMSDALTRLAESLGGDYTTYALVYRSVCLIGFLGSIAAVWTLAGRWLPGRRLPATLLYAWAPLTLIEVSAIHNDFVMLGLMGLGFVLADRRHTGWAVAVLTLAALVKWIAVVPLLLLVAALVARRPGGRQRAVALAGFAVVCVAVAVPTFLVYGSPVASALAPFSDAGSELINSWAEFALILVPRAAGLLGLRAPASDVGDALQHLATAFAVAILVVAVAAAWRRASVPGSVAVSAGALLAITLVAPRLWPWYALWALMLAAFASRPVLAASLVLSATSLLIYVLYPAPEGLTALTASRSLVVTIPVVGAWLVCHVAARTPVRPLPT